MKKRIDRRGYNRNLLTALIFITVVLCVVIVGAAILMSKGDEAENPAVENGENNITQEANPGSPEEKETETQEPENNEAENEAPENKEAEKEPEPSPTEDEPVDEDDAWMLILANPWNRLPEDFTVELTEIGSGHKVDSRIVNDLNNMMSDLRKAGHSAFVCSSYRTNAHQTNLYNSEVRDYQNRGYSDEDAAIEAAKWVAIPGTSEHQTGLAVDIMSSYYLVLDEGQEDTAEQQWLMANSYKYGFILRYPSDKSDITGIYYEPWHYRYVGVDAATEMFEKGICFEEYLLG